MAAGEGRPAEDGPPSAVPAGNLRKRLRELRKLSGELEDLERAGRKQARRRSEALAGPGLDLQGLLAYAARLRTGPPVGFPVTEGGLPAEPLPSGFWMPHPTAQELGWRHQHPPPPSSPPSAGAMIYIFNCGKEICALPGRVCTECSKLCDHIHCTCCQDVCEAMGNCCRGFTEKPLSSYVIVAGALSLAEIGASAYALNDPVIEGCRPTVKNVGVGIHSWLVLQIGFAGLNLLFAPYFQGKVWQHLLEELQSKGGPMAKVPKEAVQGSFKHVFMHDFGVLFYFFALIASCMWSWSGDHFMHVNFCNPDGSTAWAAWLGECLFGVAFLYSFCWYWCSCCARSVDPAFVRYDMEKAGPVAGAPAGGEAAASQALYYGRGPTATQGSLGAAGAYRPVTQGRR